MKRICILYSDSGAGHIVAARALKESFETDKNIKVDLVDFAIKYNVPLFSNARKSYKFVLKNMIFIQPFVVKFFDLKFPAWCFRKWYSHFAKLNIKKFLKEYPADIYISTYYSDTEVFKQIKKIDNTKKFIMVELDIMYSLRLWFDPICDLIIMPTKEAFEMGKKYFKKYLNKVELFGLPIAQNIFKKYSQNELKKELGFNNNPLIFIAGGGEGMNEIEGIVKSVDENNDDISICVVCGKDEEMKLRLEDKNNYNNNIKIFGWVDNFTQIILASDIVITKAGPATVWEILSSGKKAILYGHIGGVEDGDIQFALKNDGIVYEKDLQKISKLIKPLICDTKSIRIKDQFKVNWAEKITTRILKLF